MTIGSYTGTPKSSNADFSNKGLPEQPGDFTEISLTFDSECVVTAGIRAAPTCSYLFKMSFCRKTNVSEKACRQGSFSAYGKGPSKIEITGGTEDLVGAFGQVRPEWFSNTKSCSYLFVFE